MAKEPTPLKKNSINYGPFALVGVIVVMAILYLYPKKTVYSPTIVEKKPFDVSIENEFLQPAASLNPENDVEKTAMEAFFLDLESPKDGTIVTAKSVLIKGKTVANAEVFVNDVDAKANAQGIFSISYPLEEGDNYLIVGANDEYGNMKETELTVQYQP